MAGFYVRMDEGLQEAAEVHGIAELTGRSPQEVIGFLHGFWSWVQKQARAPGVIPHVGIRSLIQVCGGDEQLWNAVAKVEWLEFREDGLYVPGWEKRFDKPSQARADDAQSKRLARLRERQDQRGLDQPSPAETSQDAQPEVTPTATRTTSDPPPRYRPDPSDRGSVFEYLTSEHLGKTAEMVEWIEWAALQPNPLVKSDEWHYRHVLAAAKFSLGGDTPMAYFKWIVGKKNWKAIPADSIQEAAQQLRLNRTLDRLREEMKGAALRKLRDSGRKLTKQQQHALLTLSFPKSA